MSHLKSMTTKIRIYGICQIKNYSKLRQAFNYTSEDIDQQSNSRNLALENIFEEFTTKRDQFDPHKASSAKIRSTESFEYKPTIYTKRIFDFMEQAQLENQLDPTDFENSEAEFAHTNKSTGTGNYSNKLTFKYHYEGNKDKPKLYRSHRTRATRLLKKSQSKLTNFLENKHYLKYQDRTPDSNVNTDIPKTREYNEVLLEFEQLVLNYPFSKSLKHFAKLSDSATGRNRRVKPFLNMHQISELWEKYTFLIHTFDKNKVLNEINFSALIILVDLLMRIEDTGGHILNKKKAVQIIEDLVHAQRTINSTYILNSFFLTLNSIGNFQDTIHLASALINYQNTINSEDDPNSELSIPPGNLDFQTKFCKSFQNTEMDASTINNLLHAHLETGNLQNAFAIYKLMPDYNISDSAIFKNSYTYCMLFKAFLCNRERLKNLPETEFHKKFYEKFFNDMMLDYIKSEIKGIPLRKFELKVLTLNIMLHATIQAQEWKLGHAVFRKIVGLGVTPNKISLTLLVQSIIELHNSNSSSDSKQSFSNKSFSTRLFKLFDLLYKTASIRNIIDATFSTVFIDSLIKLKNIDAALKIYDRMMLKSNKNMHPTVITYTTLLNGLANCGRLLDAVRCYSDFILNNTFHPSTPMLVSMYRAYLTSDPTESQQQISSIINSTAPPSLTPFHVLLTNYSKSDNLDLALELFEQMMSVPGIKPDTLTYYILFKLYSRASIRTARAIALGYPLDYQTKIGVQLVLIKSDKGQNQTSDAKASSITDHPHHPRQLLNFAIKNNTKLTLSVYNLIIGTMIGFGDQIGAQDAYNHMTLSEDLQPDSETYVTIIKMFIRTLNVASSRELLDQLLSKSVNRELKVSLFMYNGLIFETTHSGLLDLAIDIYIHMVGRSEHILEKTYSVYRSERSSSSCKNKHDKSQLFKVREYPDSFTVLYLVRALLREQRVFESLELYEDMFTLGIPPSQELTATLVNGLQRNGYFEEAISVMRDRNIRIKKLEASFDADESGV